MELIKVSCANCGGALEVGPGAELVTCGYCDARLQVKWSESACWSELQTRLDKHSTSIDLLSLKQDLARCDSDWQENRQKFLLRGAEPKEEHHLCGMAVTAIMAVVGISMLLFWASTPASPPFDPKIPFVYETRWTRSGNVQLARNINRKADHSREGFAVGCLLGGPFFLAGAVAVALANMNTKARWDGFQKASSEHQHKRAVILEQIDRLAARTD